MTPIASFSIIMFIWTVSDFISKKTKSLLSSLLIASILFLIGFKSNVLPDDILHNSSLLALGTTVLGLIIVHIGLMLSFAELKKQWRTVLIGVSATFGIVLALIAASPILGSLGMSIAAAAGVTGGTISVIMVQDVAIPLELTSVAVLPVLITAFQGIIGFPITSILLKKEANRIKSLGISIADKAEEAEVKNRMPSFLQTTSGTLLLGGIVMMSASFLSSLTGGAINEFVIALILSVVLTEIGILKKNIISNTDSFGIMMISIMLIIFGPLATVSIQDLIQLIVPLLASFIIGVSGGVIFALITGKLLKYSPLISTAIALTSLFGFPGTMILSKEAASSVGETDDEVAYIESQILPKMIIAGFSTVTITSVVVIGILVNFI